MIKYSKKVISLGVIISCVGILGIFLSARKVYITGLTIFFCKTNSQYDSDAGSKKLLSTRNQRVVVNSNGTIKYLYDNFSSYYDAYSKSIDAFDNLDNLQVTGSVDHFWLTTESRDLDKGMAILVKPVTSATDQVVVIKRNFSRLDLHKWATAGYLTAWLKVENRIGIEGIVLRLSDKNGSFREFNELPNLQINYPNSYDQDDVYPELQYPYTDSSSSVWTDYWLNKGWNYLPWRMDAGFYTDKGNFDISSVVSFEIEIKINKNLAKQTIIIDDLRVQDGVQKEKNPTNGNWYPPNGAPQYGVYDINKINDTVALNLLNVRQSQYPGNGEHGRMISKYATPMNFAMRVRFKFPEVPKTKEEAATTWLRIAYDFEQNIDPGHDWYGVFLSQEWHKFGLITVIPLALQQAQDQEPNKKDILKISKNFQMESDVLYELNLTVKGQNAEATLYEVNNECKFALSHISYTFSRQRNFDKRYPFSIESTGNIKTTIYEVEITEL